jgi:hypothetical protein
MDNKLISSEKNVMDWRDVEEMITRVYMEEIALMDDMIESIKNNYHARQITPFREICFGYMVICRNNAKAALLLIKENLIHQVHYISRNMFEMVVNLCFIDNDDSKRQGLIERYFEYRIIGAYKTLEKMRKYSSIPQTVRTVQKDREIESNYESFKNKYKDAKGKINLNAWSGKTLPAMIKEIKDKQLRDNLTTGYDMMADINNQFLHLTHQYLGTVIKEEFDGNIDYKMRYTQLNSFMISTGLVIEICFNHFQRNRPAFKERYNSIEEGRKAIGDTIIQQGLLENES